MKIPINYLQERYPLFAYSTLQKYKAEKEGDHFFDSKKDFYIFLESNYLLELKSRKKLINIIDIKDIYFLSHINNIEDIFHQNSIIESLLEKLKTLNKNNLKYELTKEEEIYSKYEIVKNIENKLKFKNINYFDEWVLLEMIINFQKYINYINILKNKMEHYKIEEEIELKKQNNEVYMLKVKNSYRQQQVFFLEKNKKNHKIIIKEKIEPQRKTNTNKKTKKRELQEPKWVNYNDEKIDLYLDHTFNFIKINYKKKYFQYNLLQIPIEWLFEKYDTIYKI